MKHQCLASYGQLSDGDKDTYRAKWREILQHVKGGRLAFL